MRYFILLLLLSIDLSSFSQKDDYDLPIMRIDILLETDTINDVYKVDANIQAEDSYNGLVGIEYRGSSSLLFSKKSFNIEIRDYHGNDINRSLFGLPKESDWVLYAPYSDKSLIRNVLVYELARQSGFYAPRTRFFELFLNNEYQGVYVLVEKIKRDKNRVDVSKMDSLCVDNDSLSGGYIYKADRKSNDAYWYSGKSKVGYQIVYPTIKNLQTSQQLYLKDYVSEFEDLLYSKEFSYNDISGWINVNSFCDFLIFSELGKNIDAYRLSTYFYKDRNSIDSLIYAGPLWDFNLAFGNANYLGGDRTDSLLAMHYPMWQTLLTNEAFFFACSERWHYLRNNSLNKISIANTIDSLVVELGNGVDNNFVRWPILGNYIWPNAFVGETYEEEVDYLKEFISDRIDWLDQRFQTTTFELSFNKENINCFPNPFSSELNLRFLSDVSGHVSVDIYNSLGTNVCNLLSKYNAIKGTNTFTFNSSVSSLPTGVYLLVVSNTKSFVSNTVIIKN